MPTKPNSSGREQEYDPEDGKYSGGASADEKSPRSAFSSFGKNPDPDKRRKLEIVLRENPAYDKTAVWIRTEEDIKTFDEILARTDEESQQAGDWSYDDWTKKDAEEAFKKGYVTVYSSKPIKQGTFVTPSLQEAHEYSGESKPYSKKVPFDEVAWIDGEQGQYTGSTKVETLAGEDRYSFMSKATPVWMKKQYSMPYKVFNLQSLNSAKFQKFKEAFGDVPIEQTYLLPADYVESVLSGKEKADPSKIAGFYESKKLTGFGRKK